MLILVAEDDEDYAEIIAETLRRDSHEVVIAGSVDGALRFAKQGKPDLAVLDVMLPDGSGLDVGRTIRDDRPDLPIIFLSSLDRASDVVAGFSAGADDYVAKPFHPSEFLARVRAVERRYCNPRAEEPQRAPSKIQARGLEFDEDNQSAYLDGKNLNCTRLEFEILREMATVPGQVLSAHLPQRPDLELPEHAGRDPAQGPHQLDPPQAAQGRRRRGDDPHRPWRRLRLQHELSDAQCTSRSSSPMS